MMSEKHMWMVSSSMIFKLSFRVITPKALVSWLYMHTSTHGMPGNTAGNHFSKVLPYCHHIAHNNSNESKWDPFMGILNFRHVENWCLNKLHKYSGCTNCSISLWPKSCVKNSLWKGTLSWWKIHLFHEGFGFLNL